MPSLLLRHPRLALSIAYDERVLAPRPWTLGQATWGARLWSRLGGGPVLELCSGVGQIGIALASLVPATVVMVDSSPVACAFARANAEAAGVADRVAVRCRPIDAALAPEERFDLVLADPPWVPTDTVTDFPEDPVHAIHGGPDGLVLARACLRTIGRHLTARGRALLQVGPRQAGAVGRELARDPSRGLVAVASRVYGDRGAVLELARAGVRQAAPHPRAAQGDQHAGQQE